MFGLVPRDLRWKTDAPVNLECRHRRRLDSLLLAVRRRRKETRDRKFVVPLWQPWQRALQPRGFRFFAVLLGQRVPRVRLRCSSPIPDSNLTMNVVVISGASGWADSYLDRRPRKFAPKARPCRSRVEIRQGTHTSSACKRNETRSFLQPPADSFPASL